MSEMRKRKRESVFGLMVSDKKKRKRSSSHSDSHKSNPKHSFCSGSRRCIHSYMLLLQSLICLMLCLPKLTGIYLLPSCFVTPKACPINP